MNIVVLILAFIGFSELLIGVYLWSKYNQGYGLQRGARYTGAVPRNFPGLTGGLISPKKSTKNDREALSGESLNGIVSAFICLGVILIVKYFHLW